MKIALIAAHDPDLVIGKDGRLPWHLPEDLAHFKHRTMGHPVVMGRVVFEELGMKPLPGRRNLVLSRTMNADNVEICKSDKEVYKRLKNEELIYVIGGAQIYRLFLPVCDQLEITLVHQSYDGDTYFPEYRNDIGTIWRETARETRRDFTIIDYQRIVDFN